MAGPWERYAEPAQEGPWTQYAVPEEPKRKTPKEMRQEAPGMFDDPRFRELGRLATAVSEAPYKAGGAVADIGAKMGLPAPVSAGAGYLTNVSLEALPMLFGGEAAKVAKVPMEAISRDLMQSALKPTLKQLKTGDAATAIDTMLEYGWNATKGGAEKIRTKIGELNEQIKEAISSSGKTISGSDVGQN